MPEITERYREIAPDIWRDLKDYIWPKKIDPGIDKIPSAVKTTFDNTSRYPQRTDPFTLDLDGDGLETSGVNAITPLLFDINATGIKQSVGWVKPDDGLLALDRNGNGVIDSGAELFGNVTPLSTGRNADDGFEALADQDTNHDGVVNSLDANFADLRVWQDVNQDGISQSTELFTLAQKGITSIHVAKTEHLTVLENGNALADLGTFTRADGSEGTTGSVGQLGDIDLAVDTFHSQFTDTIATTAVTDALPDMGGSGQVRSLRQAASMDTVAGHALASLLTQFSQATTQAEQRAQIDGLIKAWSDTSTMATTFTGAYAGHTLTVDMQAFYWGADYEPGGVGYEAAANKLTVLERFNGRTYQPVPTGTDPVNLTLWHNPLELLNISYNTLRESVYASLVVQTRLKPYLDSIVLTLDESGISFDTTAMVNMIDAASGSDPIRGVFDLIDLNRYTGQTLKTIGFDIGGKIGAATSALATDPDFIAQAQMNNVWFASSTVGGSDTDIYLGDAQNNTFNGGAGDDLLYGKGGNDTLNGGSGSNYLDGGDGTRLSA